MSTVDQIFLSQWDFSLNSEVDVMNVNLKEKYFWKCEQGHNWQATLTSRRIGNNCSVCGNKKVLAGYNDLPSTHPDIAAQWNTELNGNLLANMFTAGSRKVVWWLCEYNHSYEMAIKKRKAGRGCSVCAGKKIISGVNDISSTHPDIAKTWDAERNTVDVISISMGSTVQCYWKCSLGHQWESSPNQRLKVLCPICSGKQVLVGFNDLVTTHPKIAASWDYDKNYPLKPEDFTFGSKKKVFWKCVSSSTHDSWDACIADRTRETKFTGCPSCANTASREEEELYHWIVSLGVKAIRRDKKQINPLELDIFLPDYNLAIEYNELYWHSEKFNKDKNYHLKKHHVCKEKNIQLLQIWEDDWLYKQDIVKSMIKHKLNLSNQPRIFARQCTIVKIDKKTAEAFYEQNHIQGYTLGMHYGLKSNTSQQIVAVSTFTKRKNKDFNLQRYATNSIVVGGFTKLLKEFIRENQPDSVITFADLSVSDGSLYVNNNFVETSVIPPDYKYLYQGKRSHKFNFRIARFKNDPKFLYEPQMSELELANLNKLYRIWDSGKIKYTWSKTSE